MERRAIIDFGSNSLRLIVYEINSNSITSAGAFYRYGDNPESSAGVTELE